MSKPAESSESWTLEADLRRAGFAPVIAFLNAECTITSKTRGRFALFRPRECLRIESGRLVIAHPCASARLAFLPSEIATISGGVSVTPYSPGQLYQRVVD